MAIAPARLSFSMRSCCCCRVPDGLSPGKTFAMPLFLTLTLRLHGRETDSDARCLNALCARIAVHPANTCIMT